MAPSILAATALIAAFIISAGGSLATDSFNYGADSFSSGYYMSYPYMFPQTASDWNPRIDSSSSGMWIPDWNNYDSGHPIIWDWQSEGMAYYPYYPYSNYQYYGFNYWRKPNDRFGRWALQDQAISSITQQARVDKMLNGSITFDSSGAHIL